MWIFPPVLGWGLNWTRMPWPTKSGMTGAIRNLTTQTMARWSIGNVRSVGLPGRNLGRPGLD